MSLTCLAIGDPHFKTQNLKYARQMIDKVWDLANEKKPNFIVILGDVLHTHEKINVFAQKEATEFIARISSEFQTYLLIGNHDRPDNDHYLTDIHPFTGLKHIGTSLEVVDKGLVDTIEGRKFVFLPYVPGGRFDDAIRTLELDPNNLSDITMLFAHQTFEGAKMGGIIAKDSPLEPVDNWPLDRPPVISGHIHDFDRLQHNLIYTGTPFQHAFGDRADKSVSFITFTDNEFKHERIQLGLPVRKTFRMSPDEASKFKPPIVDDPGLVRIVITGSRGEIRALIKLGFTEAWSRSGYKVSYKYTKTREIISDQNPQALEDWLKGKSIVRSYRSALLHAASTDPNQLAWFNRLFGTNITIVT